MNIYERAIRDQREELYSIDYTQFIHRKEENAIDLISRLAQIVIGIRRYGKSTLCQIVSHSSSCVRC